MTDSKQKLSLQMMTVGNAKNHLVVLSHTFEAENTRQQNAHNNQKSLVQCSIEVWLIHVMTLMTLILFSFDNVVDYCRSNHMTFYWGNIAEHSPLYSVFFTFQISVYLDDLFKICSVLCSIQNRFCPVGQNTTRQSKPISLIMHTKHALYEIFKT